MLPFLPKYNILYHIYEKNLKITNTTEQLAKDVLYPTLKYGEIHPKNLKKKLRTGCTFRNQTSHFKTNKFLLGKQMNLYPVISFQYYINQNCNSIDKLAFSKSSSLKCIFEKLCFWWTISPVKCGQ